MRGYLAGNMVTDWRATVHEALPDVEWLDPVRGDNWFERQTAQIKAADFCLAVIDIEARHIGTVAELSAFRAMDKPRFLVICPERAADRGYDMALKLATAIASTLEEGLSLVRAHLSQVAEAEARLERYWAMWW